MKEIQKEVQIKANYKIIKASNKTFALIYCELKNILINSGIVEQIKKGDKKITKFLSKALKDYDGIYLNELNMQEGHNLIPLAIRESFATLISGTTVTPTFQANYVALGTDATAVTENDTTLGTEIIRGLFTDRTSESNIAYLDKFFGSTEVGGNSFKEIGVFIDGTGTVDSGFLLSKINIEEDISATESLTINVTITIT